MYVYLFILNLSISIETCFLYRFEQSSCVESSFIHILHEKPNLFE